jgi:hypothetical protein
MDFPIRSHVSWPETLQRDQELLDSLRESVRLMRERIALSRRLVDESIAVLGREQPKLPSSPFDRALDALIRGTFFAGCSSVGSKRVRQQALADAAREHYWTSAPRPARRQQPQLDG